MAKVCFTVPSLKRYRKIYVKITKRVKYSNNAWNADCLMYAYVFDSISFIPRKTIRLLHQMNKEFEHNFNKWINHAVNVEVRVPATNFPFCPLHFPSRRKSIVWAHTRNWMWYLVKIHSNVDISGEMLTLTSQLLQMKKNFTVGDCW